MPREEEREKTKGLDESKGGKRINKAGKKK